MTSRVHESRPDLGPDSSEDGEMPGLPTHVDVLIVGAGLSGIGAAARLAMDHPERTYAVLEKRADLGGTWDLFRYPGVRSDSDMYTLGYRFRPWHDSRPLASAETILRYVRDTAHEYGVDRHLHTGCDVRRAAWSSEDRCWTVSGVRDGEPFSITAQFLWSCAGYYDYDQGYTPHFEGQERFQGQIVHPQHWPEDLDYAGKRVVVIGSGATAVTLVPAMADGGAGHVTMLQRTPTYILSVPGVDPVAKLVNRFLPDKVSYGINRWKSILVASTLFELSQRRPAMIKKFIRGETAKQLPDADLDTDFNPPYGPWDQRLCLVPDADLFRSIRRGAASVVTAGIRTFTETGLELDNGETLDADIIVTATGLNLKVFGGIESIVDGEPVDVPSAVSYKALMLSGIPNFVFTIGYTNASWTLKADLVADYFVRLLTWMDKHGKTVVVPPHPEGVQLRPFMDFEAGYIQRSQHLLPQQGDVMPWTLKQSYFTDMRMIRTAPIDDGVLEFS